MSIVQKIINEAAGENMNATDGVNFAFRQNPALAKIGTPEQYSQYLDTVFPNSKVKGIVYHASGKKFSDFKDPSSSGQSHIWFSESPLSDQYGENVYAVLLDVKNPLVESDPDYSKEIRGYENPTNPDWVNRHHTTGELPEFKYDGTIRSSRVDSGKSITVRSPKQIHILGSQKDLDGFRRWMSKLIEPDR